MSGGCGCGQPVILNNPAAGERVDVEPVVLCDVLPDGTIAATVLVEPVYDASSGLRVGTRIVNPATGTDHDVQGELRSCQPPPCVQCETTQLCDRISAPSAREGVLRGDNASSGVAENGIGWTATGSAGAPFVSDQDTADGAWWKHATFPNLAYGLTTFAFDRPAVVAFSVVMRHTTTGGGTANTAQLPTGLTVLNLPAGYAYDAATGRLTVDSTVNDAPCSTWTSPGNATAARFLIARPVPAFQAQYLGGAVPTSCASVGPFQIGGITLNPRPVPFTRTVCRDCAGTVVSVTDTTLDGETEYQPLGEVVDCALTATGCDDCQTIQLCDTTAVEQTTSDATATVTASTPGANGVPGSIMGAPFNAPLTDSQAVWDGGSAVLPATADNGHTYITGLVDVIPACGDLDPAGSSILNLGVRIHNNGAGAACGLWGRFTVWANGVDLVGAPASDLGALGSGTGLAPGATVNPARTVTVSNADLLAGRVYVELNVQTGADTTPDGDGCTPNDPGVGQSITVDQFTITPEPIQVTGCFVPGDNTVPFLRHICRSCDGTITVRDTTLDGETEYTASPNGTVGLCDPSSLACDSPTTPVTTVGLCLADGTPIAVTVIRNCDGAITSEGWLDLTTGSWTAGAVPVGTVACGDSRSIQVSGTFCAVDADGEVVGLVLVEYTYDDAGAISAVRLVDATTGSTYTPPAGVTITVCPAGVQQPEQDAVLLCHTAADGTVTQIVRDYRRDENGTISGHSDYLLDGTAFDTTGGTVGICQACRDCETFELCDFQGTPNGPEAAITPAENATSGVTSTGVTWTATDAGTDPGPQPVHAGVASTDGSGYWWGNPQTYPAISAGVETWRFSEPSTVRFSVIVADSANPATLPPDVTVIHLPEGYSYDPATRQLTGSPGDNCDAWETPSVAEAATFVTNNPVSELSINLNQVMPKCQSIGASRVGGFALNPAPRTFLRTICRDCSGDIIGTPVDTETDGTTPYTALGTVRSCSLPQQTCEDCEHVELADSTPYRVRAAVTAIAARPYKNMAAVQGDVSHSTAQTIFDGGSGFIARSSNGGEHLFAAGRVNLPCPPCGNPETVNVSGTIRFRNLGPDATAAVWGRFSLWNDANQISGGQLSAALAAGDYHTATFGPITVPVADILAGKVAVEFNVEANGDSGASTKDWSVDRFALTIEGQAAGCGTPFLRRICTDCGGEAAGIPTDTIDGQTPYAPVGAVAAVRQAPACVDPASSGSDKPTAVRARGVILTAGQTWPQTGPTVPLVNPTGSVLSVTVTVLSGTADVTDSLGAPMADLPAGTSVTWSTEESQDVLYRQRSETNGASSALQVQGGAPITVTADVASRVLVHWTERG